MKTVTVEELLSWAFVHELPKGGGVDGLENVNSAWRMLEASSWGKITSFAELGTLVDTGRGDAGNFFIEQGVPHDDALAVGRAVAMLDRCDVGLPTAGWMPLGDWPETDPDLVAAAIGRALDRFTRRADNQRGKWIVSLVVGTAILGRTPDHAAEPPKIRMVERGGKPAWFIQRKMQDSIGRPYEMEVDGFSQRSGRPLKGAYRKHEFSTDPTGDIMGRLDWQLWVAALRRIEREVAPQLVDHRLTPCDRSMTPWLGEDRGGVMLVERAEKAPRKKTASAC